MLYDVLNSNFIENYDKERIFKEKLLKLVTALSVVSFVILPMIVATSIIIASGFVGT